MKLWRLKLLCLANGQSHPLCPGYVRVYDPNYIHPDGYDGGILEITPNPNEARGFATAAEAFSFWKSVAPEPYSRREDGQVNRPLTAFSAVVERA